MDKHLQPSGINSDFHGQGLSFANYRLHMQNIIRQARFDLIGENSQQIIDANSPQEGRPAQTTPNYGVLLIHGLLDSPFVMQDLLKGFQADGALARSILLPGHGTIAGDLTTVSLSAWRASVARGIEWMRQDCKPLVVVGFSTGGALALEYALQSQEPLILILIAPALKILNPFVKLSRIIRHVGKQFPTAHWMIRRPENDYAKYRSIAMNAAYQVQQLTDDLAKLLARVPNPHPTFFLDTVDDEVLSVDALQTYFIHNANPANRLWLYGNPRKQMDDPRIRYRSSAYPAEGILDFAHISLLNSPENPHYGRMGDFIDDGHYQTLWGKACLRNRYQKPSRLGALSKQNLQQFDMQRLTYNPDFVAMQTEMLTFIHTHLASSAQHQTPL